MGKVKQSSTVPGVSSHYRRKIVQDLCEPTPYLDDHHPRPQLSTFCFLVSGIGAVYSMRGAVLEDNHWTLYSWKIRCQYSVAWFVCFWFMPWVLKIS